MKKYEAYKDSGIEWIGMIPEGWNIIPMKHYFYMKGRIGWQGLKADEFLDEGPYLVTGTDFLDGRVCWDRCYHISEERYNEAPEIHVERGDLLITKDGTVGKLALIEEKPDKVSLNSHLLILRPIKNNVDNHFTYWALQSVIFKDYVGLASSGSTMASLSQEKIGSFLLVLPSLPEQQAIADYLDYKVGQIDTSVADINTQIEDLKAYRQAVISEAVTKGLNPDAPMKDSGIKWIGQIPISWEICKVKHKYVFTSGFTPPTNNDSYYDRDNGEDWVCIGDMKDRVVTETNKKISSKYIQEFDPKKVSEGSLLYSFKLSVGQTAFAGKDIFTNEAIAAFDKSCNPCLPFLYYMSQIYFIKNANYNIYGAPLLNRELINNATIVFPSLEEQQAIADYLDEKTSRIDTAIKLLENQRNDLNALRQTVISEAVTGKVDLRDWKNK